MPRSYPEFLLNRFNQELRAGDVVVFVRSTSMKEVTEEERRLLIGTVIRVSTQSVRIRYNWEYNGTFKGEPRITTFEATVKTKYCYKLEGVTIAENNKQET